MQNGGNLANPGISGSFLFCSTKGLQQPELASLIERSRHHFVVIFWISSSILASHATRPGATFQVSCVTMAAWHQQTIMSSQSNWM